LLEVKEKQRQMNFIMFKDYIKNDIQTFINLNEFAEIHNINGQNLSVLIDNDRLERRSKVEYEGIIVGDILYFASESSFIKQPKPGEMQRFDGIPCDVFDVRKDTGIYEIILKKNVS